MLLNEHGAVGRARNLSAVLDATPLPKVDAGIVQSDD